MLAKRRPRGGHLAAFAFATATATTAAVAAAATVAAIAAMVVITTATATATTAASATEGVRRPCTCSSHLETRREVIDTLQRRDLVERE